MNEDERPLAGMNKLEKVALRYTKRKDRPLVLAFNSMSFRKPVELPVDAHR